MSDGHLDIPAAYFSNASNAELQSVSPAARFGANCWSIVAGPRRLLVDAGSGSWLKARFPETGHVTSKGTHVMSAPETITDIIVTHMHADHIGGLVANGACRFPNATLHVQASEWSFWTDPSLAATVADDKRPIVELIQKLAAPMAAQVRLHEGNADLGNGIHLSAAPGHTPGHQIVRIAGGTDQVILLGDAIVSGTLQFKNPDVHYALDGDPSLAARTRKQLFQELAADQIPFAATHLEPPRLRRPEASCRHRVPVRAAQLSPISKIDPSPVPGGLKQRIQNGHVLDRVLNAIRQARLTAHGSAKNISHLRELIARRNELGNGRSVCELRTVVEFQCDRRTLRSIDRDHDFQPFFCTDQLQTLIGRKLGRNGKAEMTAGSEIKHGTGGPVRAEFRIPVNQGNHF